MSLVSAIVPATQYPPSAGSTAETYFLTLFALMAMSALSLAALATLGWMHSASPARERGFQYPVTVHRLGLASLYATVALGTSGDVAYLLAWGEVEPALQIFLGRVDRALDAASFIPFMISIAAFTLGGHVITFQLVRQPIPFDLWSSFPQLQRALKIILFALLISGGVAYAK